LQQRRVDVLEPRNAIVLEPATDDDAEPIERLNERVFGPGRFARTAYRIRETTPADPELSLVARVGTLLVGASAMTPIAIGGAPALLIGPLIVEPVFAARASAKRCSIARSRRRKRPAGSSSSWSATSHTMRGGASARRRARDRCWGRSIRPGSSPASPSLAPWVAKGAARGAYAFRRASALNPSVRGFNQSAHSVRKNPINRARPVRATPGRQASLRPDLGKIPTFRLAARARLQSGLWLLKNE
jgi:hypothetical protein